jgi:hypothetical protein
LHQQRRALDLQDRHQLHPRTAFINDLIAFLAKDASTKTP